MSKLLYGFVVSQNFVLDNIVGVSGGDQYDRGFWMGLTDMVEEGKWVWVNNVTLTPPT